MVQSKQRRSRRKRLSYGAPKVLVSLFSVLAVGVVGAAYVLAKAPESEAEIVLATEDPNFHVKTIATQFFEDNKAPKMIPILRCESNFRQFEPDGTPLKNLEGSSATGVAQILSSKHPDPKIVYRYNKRFDMDMEVEDFDINTLEGNLGYALVLYKIRGTRDWECGHKFGF